MSRDCGRFSLVIPAEYYLDGRDLYGESDSAELPLPDDLHPDAATHRLIADRFGLTEGQVKQIEQEGLDHEWPPL